jgi:hypothetical protein
MGCPWRYPVTNQGGRPVPQEGAATHVGPYVVGDDSTVLLPGTVGDGSARARLEDARDPTETFEALDALMPENRHLGGPVDYTTYLVGRMVAEHAQPEFGVPDFNLDSDRGYAWHCWDWDRHHLGRNVSRSQNRGEWECVPDHIPTPQSDFSYPQPCTPPQLFHARHDNPRKVDAAGEPFDSQWYDTRLDLQTHYLPRTTPPPPDPLGDDPCRDRPNRPHRPEFGLNWRSGLDEPNGDGR